MEIQTRCQEPRDKKVDADVSVVDPRISPVGAELDRSVPVRKISVKDMDPRYLYITTGKSRMQCRIEKKPDPLAEDVEIHYFEGKYNRCWLTAKIPLDYQVECTDIEISSKLNLERPAKRVIKGGGNVSGLKMMQCWGMYFNKFIDSPGGRELIVEAMIKEFPEKAVSVNKWVDAYKSYYNLGRLPGTIKQEIQKQFIPKQKEK